MARRREGDSMERLLELAEHGQSYWLDNLTRCMLRDGELETRVREQGLRGVTSNPAIFHKAIASGDEYDTQIRSLAEGGASVEEIYEALVVDDVRDACDVLRPVYDGSDGVDGYVSLEVSPHLIHDTHGSVDEARRLWAAVERPNLLIKIPGTASGISTMEELLYEGINVNVTLLFSVPAYEGVALSYLRALERRREDRKPLETIASVASFFLSRIDVLVDRLLAHRVRIDPESGPSAQNLYGRAGVASAKLAYQSYLRIFAGERWDPLGEAGARVQRLLWASTSTKNPLYDPVKYVEPLIGPHTVNTMPEVTIEAFARQGRARPATVEDGVEEASRVFEELGAVGVSIEAVVRQLLDEGAQKFMDPYDDLLGALAERRVEVMSATAPRQDLSRGEPEATTATLAALHERRFSVRLAAADARLWTDDPDVLPDITNRLGWMRGSRLCAGDTVEMERFAQEVRAEGVRQIILLGMGGSSLCPLVASDLLGGREDWPLLAVLDDTDPAAVRAVDARIVPPETLFVVASKSGSTIETLSLYRYFFDRVARSDEEHPGQRFVALSDAGSPLLREAEEKGFRRWFETPTDVGGRYSALSAFGLLPMALAGVDLGAVLASARAMEVACAPGIPEAHNPAVRLGAALAGHAAAGRDKLTIFASPALRSLPLWIEQLVAESTGKAGRGIVPVVGEPLAPPQRYGDDRVFVYLGLEGDGAPDEEERLRTLVEAGHPGITMFLPTREAIGGEFLRWEIATATAGALLGVNPFDEPDVVESKQNTAELLRDGNRQAFGDPLIATDRLEARYETDREWSARLHAEGMDQLIGSFADLAGDGEYIAVLGFFHPSPSRENAVRELRARLLERTGAATTFGYGPRYLHSTGQLHKGGADSGVFLLLTADAAQDIAVPEAEYKFAGLQRAQAVGDYQALLARDRRVLWINLGWYVEEGLRSIAAALGRR